MVIEQLKLFERARERWPLSFRVTPSDGTPPFHSEPSLVNVYKAIEASCDPTGEWTPADNWTQLANWAFHQSLFGLARQFGLTGEADSKRHFRREDVTFEMFDHWMRFNLSDDGYTAERKEYEASPLRLQ